MRSDGLVTFHDTNVQSSSVVIGYVLFLSSSGCVVVLIDGYFFLQDPVLAGVSSSVQCQESGGLFASL